MCYYRGLVRWQSLYLFFVLHVIGFPSFSSELNRTLSLHSYRSHAHTSKRIYPSVLTETDSDPHFAEKHANFGMDIVFINLDTSHTREHYMRETLRFYGFDDRQITRISAFRPEDIVVAPSLQEFGLCNHLSHSDFNKIVSNSLNSTNSKVFLEATCGRKKNSLRELTVTLSHLLALHHTLYHSESFHNFALILEDDLHLYMEVDFEALINSAPPDFAVLQLVTSNDYSVSNLWRVFLRHKLLWVKRKDKDDYWCAGAYIVRKDALAPYLNQAFSQLELPEVSQLHSNVHHYRANVVAAYVSPCFPKSCCHGSKLRAISDPAVSSVHTDTHKNINISSPSTNIVNNNFFNKEKLLQQPVDNDIPVACVRSPRGFQSDSFIFTLAPTATYMLTIPIFTNSETGNVSTVHQRHVAWHQASFRRGRKILSVLLSGRVGVKVPTMLNPQCRIGSGVILHSQYDNETQNKTESLHSKAEEEDVHSDVISEEHSRNMHWQSFLQEKHEQEEWIQGLLNHKRNILDT